MFKCCLDGLPRGLVSPSFASAFLVGGIDLSSPVALGLSGGYDGLLIDRFVH